MLHLSVLKDVSLKSQIRMGGGIIHSGKANTCSWVISPKNHQFWFWLTIKVVVAEWRVGARPARAREIATHPFMIAIWRSGLMNASLIISTKSFWPVLNIWGWIGIFWVVLSSLNVVMWNVVVYSISSDILVYWSDLFYIHEELSVFYRQILN